MELEVKKDVVMQYIKMKNWSLRKTAQKMNISPSYLSRVLKGERKPNGKFVSGALNTFKGLSFEEIFFYTHTLPKGDKDRQHKNVS